MRAKSLRLVVIAALCVSQGAFAASSKRHPPTTDQASSYKADRLSSSRGETILNTPGQTTVLTREVLDDKNATSLKDAMRSTAGVTIGR
ncbi:outer membrane receptor for monomeric catechols [Bradyrhizobium sp. USDA 3686]|uniref:TonB-dependent receptor plug domain-containing protein n=1 Tax=Bradyrhizobium TaxID=374 RepID=UPI00195EB7BF|nr:MULTISPECIES: TonB-dependent receptor plug domain-containing protein [Bradyrhizobium]MBM7484308.1 outer membrane receptor for monomeric catechols [Bradyrhizobium canariense]UFW74522.1 Plug domain-containing protein [Bradyrhizobium canariense]